MVLLLLEGRPGSGKTTVARRLAAIVQKEGFGAAGFTTEEIREGRRRVGFAVETLVGERAVLAHMDLPGPPRVGKYGVDLPAFEALALPELDRASNADVVILDELGKMELASEPFRDRVVRLIEAHDHAPVIATVHVYRHPTTDALKARPDAERFRVTSRTREGLPRELADRLLDR